MRLALIAFLSFAWLPLAAGEIYQTTDDLGNPVYTDVKPHDHARATELPALTIAAAPAAHETADQAPAKLELHLISPLPGETIQGTGNAVTVQLEATGDVPDDALIVIYFNGRAMEPVDALTARFEGIDRGEHRLRAELQTADGQLLAATGEIVFYMRQASRLHPRN